MIGLVAELASPDVRVVQDALEQIAAATRAELLTLATPTLVEDGDGEGDEDGVDFDDEGHEGDDGGDDDDGDTFQARSLPPLDDALDQHLPQLAIPTLLRVFVALFQTCRDNFPAAARIAAEIARRGEDAAQLALVDTFIAASASHDTGHRTDDSVHDVLIDEVFPTLNAPALTRLLTWCTNRHLDDSHGDRMFALFYPALATAGDAERATLVQRLGAFMREIHDLEPDRAETLWTSLDTLPRPAEAAVAALRAHMST